MFTGSIADGTEPPPLQKAIEPSPLKLKKIPFPLRSTLFFVWTLHKGASAQTSEQIV